MGKVLESRAPAGHRPRLVRRGVAREAVEDRVVASTRRRQRMAGERVEVRSLGVVRQLRAKDRLRVRRRKPTGEADKEPEPREERDRGIREQRPSASGGAVLRRDEGAERGAGGLARGRGPVVEAREDEV